MSPEMRRYPGLSSGRLKKSGIWIHHLKLKVFDPPNPPRNSLPMFLPILPARGCWQPQLPCVLLVLLEQSRKVSANPRSLHILVRRCLFQFGKDLFGRFQHLWIHRRSVKHSRRAVHADAPADVADTSDLRVLFCLRAACGDTTKGSCVWHQPHPVRRFSQGRPCDEHCCGGPQNSHHLRNVKRRV